MSRNRWCAVAAIAILVPPVARAQDRSDSTGNVGWKQLGIGAAVLTAVITLDAPITRRVHGSISPGALTTARQFDRFGDLTGIGPIIGGLVITGVLTHNRKVTQAALHAFESVVLASVVAQAAKHVVGRVRPYADPDLDATDFRFFSDNPAFPSGHSAAAFAMATSLGDALNNRWTRVGLYGLAVGAGWARLAEEQHWLTDVVAGAAVGIVSAKFVSGRLRVFGMRAPHLIVGPESMGLGWTF